MSKRELTEEEQEQLLKTLEERFEKNMHRHEGVNWQDVEAKLRSSQDKLFFVFRTIIFLNAINGILYLEI